MWKKPLKINVKKLIPNTFGKLISWQVNWERNEVNMLIRRIWKGEWKMPLLHHFVDNPEHRLADYPKHCYWMQTQWCCPVQIRLEDLPSEIEKTKKGLSKFFNSIFKKIKYGIENWTTYNYEGFHFAVPPGFFEQSEDGFLERTEEINIKQDILQLKYSSICKW